MSQDYTQNRKARELSEIVSDALPAAEDCERGLLCCVLTDPETRVPEVLVVLPKDGFYHPISGIIWRTVVEMVQEQHPVDIATLADKLKAKGHLEKVGGAAYLSELFTFVSTPAYFGFYLAQVKQRYILRCLVAQCLDTVRRCQSHGSGEVTEDAAAIVGHHESAVFSLMEQAQSQGDNPQRRIVTNQELVLEWIEQLQEACAPGNRGTIKGIRLGNWDLDRVFGGFGTDAEGDMLLVCAYPGMGKSVACISFLEEIAIEQGVPTLVFPFEMGRSGYMSRLIPGRANVDTGKIRNKHLGRGEWAAISDAATSSAPAPIFWDHSAFLDIASLRAKVQVHVRQHGVRVIIIDHFGQLKPSTERGRRDDLQGEKEIMEGLHAIRMELGVLIILACQLTKSSTDRPRGALPIMADVKGATEKTEYATHIMFICRPVVHTPWVKLGEEKQEAWERSIDRYRRALPTRWASTEEIEDGKTTAQQDYEEHSYFCVRKNRHGATPEQVCSRFVAKRQRFLSRTSSLYDNNPDKQQVTLPGFF